MRQYEEQAKAMADAIREFNNNPEALDNFEDYLAHHFDEWVKKYASTPVGMAYEFKMFADMDFGCLRI